MSLRSVAASPARCSGALLRRHVSRRADYLIDIGEFVVRSCLQERDAKIGKKRSLPIEKNVGRLDVAVNDAVLMRMLQSVQ